MAVLAMMAAITAAAGAPTFVEAPCADARLVKLARCGTVTVPENRDAPGGRTIALNVMVLPAVGPASALPPLFDIDGGPGLPATKNAGFYLTAGSGYRSGREVVLVDQRGTGGSNGLLCPELSRPEDAYKPMLPPQAVASCRQRLEQTADLTRYGTREAVADLDAVRQALGHDRLDVFALSYGTTVALRYMATYPGRVRAAVLMGTAGTDAMPPRHHATAGQQALDRLIAACAADAGCRAAFPSPAADFDQALARLPSDGELSAPIFAEKIRTLTYSPAGARKVPWILNRAAAGDLAPFKAATQPTQPLPYADGMFLSVTCTEGIALMDGTAAGAAARKTRFGDYRLRRQQAACADWPKGEVAPDHLAPVASEAAALLISGRLDPATPPEWADAVARHLPNARHLVIPSGGHILDGLEGADTCFDPLVLRFFATGNAKALDASCLAQMKPPAFTLGGETR